MAQGCDNCIYCNRKYLESSSLDTKYHYAAVYFNCYTTLLWLFDMRFVKLRISGSVFRSGFRRRNSVVRRELEVQLEIESRTISALGPAGFHA